MKIGKGETKTERYHNLKGTNQVAMGNYNELLVLHLIREHGELSKVEATHATGLSANAISTIFRSLENNGLIVKGEPIRGKVGQPSTPLRLNPHANHYVAMKIGRRSFDICLIDFVGNVIAHKEEAQNYPTPSNFISFLEKNLDELFEASRLSKDDVSHMAIAMPFELWSWADDFGAPKDELAAWKTFDLHNAIRDITPWKILIENDGTAACRAEAVFGNHRDKQDWIYFYVGTFIGGGIVLNGSVFTGRRGNAGGFGPMRVPGIDGGNRLIDHASLVVLERMISNDGFGSHALNQNISDWSCFEPHLSIWVKRCSDALSKAIVSSLSVLDFEAVVIDGAMPEEVRLQIVKQVEMNLKNTDMQGIVMPAVEEGQMGRLGRTLGAAAALISKEYMLDQNNLLRA